MHKWQRYPSRVIAYLLIFAQLNLPLTLFAAESSIGWNPPADSFICGKDIDGDGKWDKEGETALCDGGATYDPVLGYNTGYGYIDEPPTYACPIDKTSCDKEDVLMCPFNGDRCEEGENTCSRPQTCNSFQSPYTHVEACTTNTFTAFCTQDVDSLGNNIATCSNSGDVFTQTHVLTDGYIDDCNNACTDGTCTTGINGSGESVATCPSDGSTFTQYTEPSDSYLTDCADACIPDPDTYTCPLTGDEYSDINACSTSCRETRYQTKYRCPFTGSVYNSSSSCNSACEEVKACDKEKEFLCPLGEEFACVNMDESNSTDDFVCSTVSCGDYASNNTKDPVDRDILLDDGERSPEGECLDQLMIFSGRAMDCRKPGISSAFQDCCDKDDGEIYHDSMGSIIQTYSYMDTIYTTYEAASAAYAVFSAGGTSAEAANAATEVFTGAFDPTSMAIAVAVMLVMAYLEKACPPEDIETAILDASNHCVTLGNKCTKKWFGSCVQEVEVKCCFNSMLAKIIQEQGRPQLGMSFGTPKAPACQGFTPEEFQSLDFSKIDLSEYYRQLQHKNQSEMQSDLGSKISTSISGG